MTYKKYAKSVQLFLCFALIVNFISLTISIIYKIPLLTGLSLLLSLYLIMIKRRHQMNFIYNDVHRYSYGKNVTFIQYLKSLLFRKGFDLFNDEISSNIKSTVHFMMNPDTKKEEGVLHSSISKPVSVRKLKRNSVYYKSIEDYETFLFGYDIPPEENSNSILNEGVELAADMEDFCLSKTELLNHHSLKNKIILKLNLHEIESNLKENVKNIFHQNLKDKRVMAIEIDCQNNNSNESDSLNKNGTNIFKNSTEILYKVNLIKELSNGKPVGIRSVFRNSQEIISLCSSINDTGLHIDFISVQGLDSFQQQKNYNSENESSKPFELEKAVFIINEVINRFSLQNKIKIWATGKIDNGFELVKLLSLGATTCINTSFIGTIQNTNYHKDLENRDYFLFKLIEHHNKIKKETLEILKFAGFSNFNNIDQKRFFKIINRSTIKRLDDCYKTELYQFNTSKEFMHLN